ncbi:MAG: DUF1080 domain-containing protein [Planctomycetes bacterium]|nr:DUF1080 domain-containing protein [Planctomycetota bacterium]
MIHTLILPSAFLVAAASLHAQELTDAERKDGFRLLFDGKSFDGWKTSDKTPKSWKIEEGLLKLNGGSSHLFTKDTFEDFILRLEWRPAKKGYNSGLFIRGNNQIQMQQQNCGHLMSNTKETKGVPKLHKAPGEWNAWEVVCVGSKISLKVNGTQAWEIDTFKAKKGPIGIEAEGHAIDFKNLRIKVLKKD